MIGEGMERERIGPAECARRVGVDSQTVYRWRGNKTEPRLAHLRSLVREQILPEDVLSRDDLFGGEAA
jgi:hypothetical protein